MKKFLTIPYFAAAFLSLTWNVLNISTSHASSSYPEFTEPLNYIYQEVILPNAQQAEQACFTLEKALDSQQPLTSPDTISPHFLSLIKAWKAVQTSYVLGDLNEDFIDTPSRIDIFRQGKEDWQAQLTRALAGTSAPNAALFKHSYRSLNALEFVLFHTKDMHPRQQAFAHHITQSLCKHFSAIHQGYQTAHQQFLQEPDKSLAYLIHSLASSIFSSRDWRIGDVVGLSRKYRGKPDLNRAEYRLSDYSREALHSIFSTQQAILSANTQQGLYQILKHYQETKLAEDIQKNLQAILTIIENAPDDATLFSRGEQLYAINNQLYQQYYISIITALPIVAKVLDADGD